VGTEQLRDDCVTEINDAVEKYKEAQKTLAVTNKVEETTEVEEVGDVKPVLFPNDLAENCQRLTCGTKFSWWGRGRHHCKCCGAVLCSLCSSNEAPLAYINMEPRRVCDFCFDSLKERYEDRADLISLFKSSRISEIHKTK